MTTAQLGATGLSVEEAALRLRRDGPNLVPPPPRTPAWRLLLAQLTHFFAGMLWVASLLALIAGMTSLAVAIAVIVLLNGVFAFAQEHKADRAAAQLDAMMPATARVRRAGDDHQVVINVHDLVVGDVLLIAAGDRIGADLRVLDAHELTVYESMLTGESVPSARGVDGDLLAGTFAHCAGGAAPEPAVGPAAPPRPRRGRHRGERRGHAGGSLTRPRIRGHRRAAPRCRRDGRARRRDLRTGLSPVAVGAVTTGGGTAVRAPMGGMAPSDASTGDPAADRESELVEREARADEREAARAAHASRVREILEAAEVRDGEADARDTRAETRDKDADLKAFLTSEEYGDDIPARRSAAMDRLDSRTDRTSAASDRAHLVQADPPETEPDRPESDGS